MAYYAWINFSAANTSLVGNWGNILLYQMPHAVHPLVLPKGFGFGMKVIQVTLLRITL